jgi:hypothetical protein
MNRSSRSGQLIVPKADAMARSKWRLLGMLFLFDLLLIIAVLLSFQETELVGEEVDLYQTRQVYEMQLHEQIVTDTLVITEIVPYGSRY